MDGGPLDSGAIRRFMRDGYLIVDSPPDVRTKMQRALTAGVEFFGEALEAKLANRLPLDTGYRPYGQEYSLDETHPDEVESFTASRRVRDPELKLQTSAAKRLNSEMLVLFDGFEVMAANMTSSLAREFAVAQPKLEAAFTRWSLLQMNYSRPSQVDAAFINDPHEDGCLLTIMSLVGPGFELKSTNGKYKALDTSPNQILIMAGEILSLITGGKIAPVYHRVRTDPTCKERLSLLFFADMNPTLCTPWIHSRHNEGIDIGQRVLQNSIRYGLAEWTPE
jgi:isopenicillin N synthase-like dioxygenase